MKVWIDLSNSPHPLLFDPLARRLSHEGATTVITLRDTAQTLQLARERWPQATVIGGPTPPGRVHKAQAMTHRVGSLLRWARKAKPDIALSHNSYGQLLAARLLRIPSVTAMDYEFQPANHVAFRAATRILLPEAIPATAVRHQGAIARKVIRYPGVKEELYLGDFTPDPLVLSRLGIQRRNGMRLVVVRTPPLRAAYHRFGNPLFIESLRVLGGKPDVRCVVLARHLEDRREVEGLELQNCLVPSHVVDARSLMREADLMIGAGGTMTREAAVMGVPTYSVFRGARPAVDVWLEKRGALSWLESPQQLEELGPRAGPPADLNAIRVRAHAIEDAFVETVMETAGRGKGVSS